MKCIALILMIATAAACATTNRQPEKTPNPFDAEMAWYNERQSQLDVLFKQCLADRGKYFKHPQPPLIRSCLEFGRLMQQGIKDVSLKTQCNSDLMKEISSCSKYETAYEAVLRASEERSQRSHEDVERLRLREGW
jgi:hypothetical protein